MLRIASIADPANPHKVGFCPTGPAAVDVDVAGSYAYVTDWMNGLQVISVVDPTQPELVGYYRVPAGSHGVSQNGDFEFVTGYDTTVHAISAVSPKTPVEVGHYRLPVLGVLRLEAVGDYVYVTNNEGGLRILQYCARSAGNAARGPATGEPWLDHRARRAVPAGNRKPRPLRRRLAARHQRAQGARPEARC